MTKLATQGHNTFASTELVSITQRIERLEEEKKALADDIREVYAEAKTHGFDTKILRKCIQLRKLATADRMEMDAIIDLYMSVLGRADKDETAKSLAEADDA